MVTWGHGGNTRLKRLLSTQSSVGGLSWILDVLLRSQVALEQAGEERPTPSLQGSSQGPLPRCPSPGGLEALLACTAFPLPAAASEMRLRLPGLLCLWGPALLRGLCKPRENPEDSGQDRTQVTLAYRAQRGQGGHPSPSSHEGAMRAPSGSGLRAQPASGPVQSGE